ncbi:MAG: DUF89 family protein [Desulfuromonadaceae bacterium]|nr:DUF89 family protein [Desulfuromonadaceae bacterium]
MDIQLDCLPCFVKQTLSVLRMVDADEAEKERILRRVLEQLSHIDFAQSPPQLAQDIHAQIRQLADNPDPYAVHKRRDQELALRLYPPVEQQVRDSEQPFYAAVQMAIAGNSLDHGVYHDLSEEQALALLEQGLVTPVQGDLAAFQREVERARSILYLGDNAGEIVFDRLLLQQLPREKVTYVVRGGPIINDAQLQDAREAGIDRLVATLMDNGDDSPGTVLSRCSAGFREKFHNADLIIAKGQGNYETLSDEPGNIVFLLKAKCPVVATHIGCDLGASLLYRRSGR